jgi:hypothetical protein
MTATIQIRRDTFANWNGSNPTLVAGEIGLDTTNGAIKIGTGALWNATPYLAATIPSLSNAASDLNDPSFRVQGRYILGTPSSMTNAPAAPINIHVDDGRGSLLVLTFGTSVVQMLWTEGDGTRPQKSWHRIYDGDAGTPVWRSWVADNIWATSPSEGVDVIAKSITLKDTGTGLTVDGNATVTGNSTLTGNVTVNGTATFGTDPTDILTVSTGTATNPIITTHGDTNTGIYFPAADDIAFTAGGTRQLLLDNGATGATAATFRSGASLSGILAMNANRITNVADASSQADALSWSSFIDKVNIVYARSNGSITATNLTNWTVSTLTTQATFTPSAGGTYDGVILLWNSAGQLLVASGKIFTAVAVPQALTSSNCDTAMMIAFRRT